MRKKEYLGDGAYIENDGTQVRIFCERAGGEHEGYQHAPIKFDSLKESRNDCEMTFHDWEHVAAAISIFALIASVYIFFLW